VRVLRLPGLGVRCAVTDHALERYAQRVRPHLEGDQDALWADLRRLVEACGTTSPKRPEWVREDWTRGEVRDSDLWVHCGDVALVVGESAGRCPAVMTTVLCRGGISEIARAGRNKRRSARTYRKGKAKHDARKAPRRSVDLPEPT
jgi:hypothetical protein